MHLILDGISTNMALMTIPAKLTEWLNKAVAFIGMTVIGEPRIVDFKGENGHSLGTIAGLSGDVILAESSITVHTYPEKGLVCIDIYSCKSFNFVEAIQMIRDSFGIRACDYATWTLKRPLFRV